MQPARTELQKNPNYKLIVVITHLIINFGIGGLLYWLCTKCNYTAAWIVLLLPFIFGIIFLAIIFVGLGVAINNKKTQTKK